MEKLSQTSINGVPIIINFVPKGNYQVRPALAMNTPKTIAIHNTGNKNKGADAKAHNTLLHNQSKLGTKAIWASYQYVVDDKAIYQNIPLNESAWHTGDGVGVNSGNRTAIGIEICENEGINYAKAEENAAYLVAALMKAFNLGIAAVKPHQAYSGKYCPHIILSRSGGFSTFTNAVLNAQKGTTVTITDNGNHVSPNTPTTDRVEDSYTNYKLVSKVNDLNFYSKATFDTKYKIGTVNKGLGFPTIVKKVAVGNAYQYEVKNSNGAIYYITASNTYVDIVKKATTPIPTKYIGKVTVDKITNFTYLYTGMDALTIFDKAVKNAVYNVVKKANENWYLVESNGKNVYIKSKYVTFK